MGHHISAIIGNNDVNKDKIRAFGLAAAFESEYVIVILDFDSIMKLQEILDKSIQSNSPNLEWDCDLVHYIAKAIGLSKYILIQTDYFGNDGEQYASYYENGQKLISEVSINKALKELGVKTKDNLDQFDSLNLSDYRDSEYYYWNTGNWADKKENMIPGRVLKT